MAQFNQGRWRRAGATADQLDALEAAFAALDPDAQEHETARLAGLADSDLEAQLAGLETQDLDLPTGEGDAKGGPGGSDPEAEPVDASPLPVERTGTDTVAGHDAP